eukprot:757711-Hanusia_phi.AAC.2
MARRQGKVPPLLATRVEDDCRRRTQRHHILELQGKLTDSGCEAERPCEKDEINTHNRPAEVDYFLYAERYTTRAKFQGQSRRGRIASRGSSRPMSCPDSDCGS